MQTRRLHSAQAQVVAVQARFDAFTEQVDTLGKAQEAKNKEKESQDAKAIRDAVTGRDIALNSLRNEINRASGRPASLTPAAPAGSGDICFDPPAFAAAVERYRGRVRAIVGTGEEAQIDARTLLEGWPK